LNSADTKFTGKFQDCSGVIQSAISESASVVSRNTKQDLTDLKWDLPSAK
jgi:hypothetical protein